MEKFKRASGLRQVPSFFSSHTLTQSKNSPSPACSCIYAWSALPLVPSAHFIIHTYSTVATGNTTISASTALLHFISMSDRSVLRSGYSKLPHHLKWTCTYSYRAIFRKVTKLTSPLQFYHKQEQVCFFTRMKRKVNLHRANKPVTRSGSQLRQSDHQYHPDGRKRICCMLRSPESGPPESQEEHDVSGQQHAAELLRLTWWQHRWMFCSLLGKHWYMISELVFNH